MAKKWEWKKRVILILIKIALVNSRLLYSAGINEFLFCFINLLVELGGLRHMVGVHV